MDLETRIRQEIAQFEAARPVATEDIVAVWVFSGFGTYLKPILPHRHKLWGAWNDQHNLSRGILLTLEVTALITKKNFEDVTREDVINCGPKLIYNGEPPQNEDLRAVSSASGFPIPKENLVIVDFVQIEGNQKPISNTPDQFRSFPRWVLESTVGGDVALVSGAPHFSRLLRYNALQRPIPERFRVRSFPVPSFDKDQLFADQEVGKLLRYLETGDLDIYPFPTDLGL